MITIQNYSIISWMVLIFSVSVVVITLIPTLFPALYSITYTETLLERIGIASVGIPEPFELGFFFISVVITNIIVFSLIIISKFKKTFTIPHYNISKRNATIGMIILLAIFSGLSYEDITTKEEHMDWANVKENLELWDLDSITNLSFEVHVRKILLIASDEIFGNYNIIPTIASAMLLVTVYLFTNKITNNRFAGLISVGFLLQSNIFLSFSSIATYTVFWVLFYLISTYTILQRNWFITPIAYVLAILSKPLVVIFLPLTIFFVLNSKIPNKNKFGIIIVTLIIVSVGGYYAIGDNPDMYEGFNVNKFLEGFTSFSYQMRWDWLSVIFLLPIIVGLFFISKNNVHANNISIMISGIIFSTPLLVGLTDITSQPYRFVPLIVFLAIAVGMIIANKNNEVIPENIKTKKKGKKNH